MLLSKKKTKFQSENTDSKIDQNHCSHFNSWQLKYDNKWLT